MGKSEPTIADVLEAVDNLAVSTGQQFISIDKRFDQVDKRFEQVDKRFDQVDKRFEQVDKRFENIEGKLGQIDGRLFRLEKGQTELIEKVDRIEGQIIAITSDIREIYDRLVVLEKRQDLTEQDIVQLKQDTKTLIAWAEKVGINTKLPFSA